MGHLPDATRGIMTHMKDPPGSLPPANSPKWHSRRHRDPLGYLRVRTLSNPHNAHDAGRLARTTQRMRTETSDPVLLSALDQILLVAHRYEGRQKRDVVVEEQAWDDLLSALDEYLELLQAQHLRDVRAAGCSGI